MLKFYKVQDKMKTIKEIDNPYDFGFESVYNCFLYESREVMTKKLGFLLSFHIFFLYKGNR